MRYNALITTLSIMLLQITKFITVAIAVLAVVFSLSSSFEAPLGFLLDDQYRVEAYMKPT